MLCCYLIFYITCGFRTLNFNKPSILDFWKKNQNQRAIDYDFFMTSKKLAIFKIGNFLKFSKNWNQGFPNQFFESFSFSWKSGYICIYI
jgi:hypothetical protein